MSGGTEDEKEAAHTTGFHQFTRQLLFVLEYQYFNMFSNVSAASSQFSEGIVGQTEPLVKTEDTMAYSGIAGGKTAHTPVADRGFAGFSLAHKHTHHFIDTILLD